MYCGLSSSLGDDKGPDISSGSMVAIMELAGIIELIRICKGPHTAVQSAHRDVNIGAVKKLVSVTQYVIEHAKVCSSNVVIFKISTQHQDQRSAVQSERVDVSAPSRSRRVFSSLDKIQISEKSIIILRVCAHNPNSVDHNNVNGVSNAVPEKMYRSNSLPLNNSIQKLEMLMKSVLLTAPNCLFYQYCYSDIREVTSQTSVRGIVMSGRDRFGVLFLMPLALLGATFSVRMIHVILWTRGALHLIEALVTCQLLMGLLCLPVLAKLFIAASHYLHNNVVGCVVPIADVV
uniref:Uncharacterized protein n=1 Tax=Glossina pallidipes TaxID=7398 RepID=A0A1A9Z8G5_GLOPL